MSTPVSWTFPSYLDDISSTYDKYNGGATETLEANNWIDKNTFAKTIDRSVVSGLRNSTVNIPASTPRSKTNRSFGRGVTTVSNGIRGADAKTKKRKDTAKTQKRKMDARFTIVTVVV